MLNNNHENQGDISPKSSLDHTNLSICFRILLANFSLFFIKDQIR